MANVPPKLLHPTSLAILSPRQAIHLLNQHFALKALFQGNILDIGLPFIPLEENARILDVGCGPGTWIMDIATEYPTSEFIGIDMCDVFPTNIRPPNVTFQVGNVLERLPFPDNSFDFVNIRLFIIALKKEQWPIVFAELFRVTKPGGCIQSTEAGMLNRGNEFVLRAGLEFENAIDRLGQDPHVAKKLGMLVEQAGFDVLHHEIKDAPLRGSDRLNREFLWDIAMIFKTGEQMLLGPLGLTSEEYPQFLDRLCKECQKLPEAKWCFGLCFGRKPVQ
ncbi:hypothetical protein DFQ30_008584 [Apophysomyces sp. BC1015]|nr:hypothetical protein DFQ30_008584 [Apophysomyces sp. BC1015]